MDTIRRPAIFVIELSLGVLSVTHSDSRDSVRNYSQKGPGQEMARARASRPPVFCRNYSLSMPIKRKDYSTVPKPYAICYFCQAYLWCF